MNVLFLVNTYSQLIIALQIWRTYYKNDKVSVVISDFSQRSHIVSEKLREVDIFENVFFVECKKMESKSNLKKMMSLKTMVFGTKYFEQITKVKWDRLIYYNRDAASYSLFRELIKKNPRIETAMYEEGILSYSFETSNRRILLAEKIWNLIGLTGIRERTKRFYCFYPGFYCGNLVPIEIPLINENDVFWEKTLIKLFDIDKEEMQDTYSGKYIFFTGVYDFEGGKPIGELELVEKVEKIVEKNHLIVKVHPRDDTQRFVENGITVADSSSIPWEAIQLSCNIKNCTFLTVVSGSVLMPNLMVSHPYKTFFLFDLCDVAKNYTASKNRTDLLEIIDKKSKIGLNNWLIVATSIDNVVKN